MQFLLNADGSLPLGTNLAALVAAGVRLTLPVAPHAPAPGMQVIDLGDGEDIEGVWHQKWTEVAAPEQPATVPDLSRSQFTMLLAMQPLRDILESTEAALRASADPQAQQLYAAMQGYRARDIFPFDLSMEIVARFAPFLPEGVSISPETITPMWLEAAAF
jgi:hypothetical protein